MLSIEKPPPSDPQCSNKYHHHNTNTDNHHHHHHLLPLPLVHPPLTPNFSIRDYVFTARSKDIKTNWPFSLKNLQLCLKHGVKDVLPPFESVDAVRNQVCTVDNGQSIFNNITNDDDEPSASKPADHQLNCDIQCPQEIKLPSTFVDSTAVNSCRSGESNLFPSTTTSVCQSEIEQSVVSAIKSTSSPLQADTSLEAVSVSVSVAGEPAAPRASSHKAQTTLRSSGKNKCKLIVKFGSHSDRSSTEDIASNCTTQSETMASKICPVCKTFTSSSNTTLNAHIDQCLSTEDSTPKWTVDSKLTRHRIKPRKTRLMVDIYATALPCTLEDLDRRNGSNWASPSRFPISDLESDKSEVPVEETMKHRASPVSPNDRPSCVDVGDVYIDSNGIKLRILSKSDNALPISKVIQHLRPRKPFKGGKGSKFFSARKKKRRAAKFSKYLKLAQNKKLRSSKALASQICGGLGKSHVAEGISSEKEGSFNIPKQIYPSSSGTLRQWACSKRTGLVKKFNNKMRHQHVQSCWNVSEDLRAEIDQSHFHTSPCQNHEEDEVMDLSGSPVSRHDITDGLENMLSGAHGSHAVEPPPVGKGAASSLSITGIKTERPITPMKRNARQLRREISSEKDYHMLQPPKSTSAISTSLPSTIDNSDSPPAISAKSSSSCHASTRSKARKVSSAMLSSKRTRVDESTSDDSTKCAGLKKSQFHLRTDEEMVPLDSEAIQPCDHNFSVNYQCGRDGGNEESSFCRQNMGVLGVSRRKEPMVSESSQLPFEYPHDDGSSYALDKVDDVGPGCQVFQCPMDDIVSQPSPKIAVRETVLSSHCKSGNPDLNKSVPKPNSLQHNGLPCNVQEITVSSGQSLGSGGQEMFYADQLRNGTLGQNINMGEDLDSEVARGSIFAEVDPIPIPGPPGSFLPSPRDMGSEDFQGNSSLTTSRIQSSQDQHDFIDGDSSDSPASATSTISNSTAGRYDLRSSESLPYIGPHAAQDNVRSGFSGGSIDSSIENAALITRSTNVAAERLASFDKAKFKVNQTPLSFKTDNDEPCCCQRKERASQDVILNSQESQLLKRRLMASASFPDVYGQTSCNLKIGPNNVEVWGDIICSNSCPTLNSEKVVLPAATKLPLSQHVLRGPMDGGVKFSGRSDCDSMSPSSNSILRLMGKNLMVVNRDEDKSMPTGVVQPQSQINHLTPQFSTFTGVSPTSASAVQSQSYHHSFPTNFHRSSVSLGRDPQNVENARLSNVNRSQTSNPRTSQMLYQGPAYPFQNQYMDGVYANAIEFCQFKADYTTAVPPQTRLKHRPFGGMDQIPDHQHKNLLSAANNPVKEIITIDDASESEADLTRDVAEYAGGFVRSHVVSSNVVNPSYNAKCVTPNFHGSRGVQEQGLLAEVRSVQNTGFEAIPGPGSRQANVRWPSSCISDGSSVLLQQSPFIATPSSSRGQLRSVLYK